MSSPKVSVILPVYNKAFYLPKAVQSILEQSYSNWELIIIDDGSTDDITSVIDMFDDSRIRFIHQENSGVSAARNTGIGWATGEYLNFLDADDIYHPDKILAQVTHLQQYTKVGLSYTSRITIDKDGDYISLVRAPAETSIRSLLLRWPISMNDFMIRRHWIEKIGGFDERISVNEDRDFLYRTRLAGCQFARIDRFLTYRRLFSDLSINDLSSKLSEALMVLNNAFSDPLCPIDVISISKKARRNVYLEWAYRSAIQSNTSLSCKCFRDFVRLDSPPSEKKERYLLDYLVQASVRDNGDHESRLQKVFSQLPPDVKAVSGQLDWAIARGHLEKGIRAIMWGDLESGQAYLSHAIELEIQVEENFIKKLAAIFLDYENAFGEEAAQTFLNDLSPYLNRLGRNAGDRRLRALLNLNQGFQSYNSRQLAEARNHMIRAIIGNPIYLTNPGALSVILRSFRPA